MLGGRPGGMCCILQGEMDSPCLAHPKLPWKPVTNLLSSSPSRPSCPAPYEHFNPSPFPETRGSQRSASGRNSSSPSSKPRASHVPLLPFTPHHICSHSRVPAAGYLRGGGRRQRAPGALGLQRAPQPRGCKRAWRAKTGAKRCRESKAGRELRVYSTEPCI